jgi:hypothetical protein
MKQEMCTIISLENVMGIDLDDWYTREVNITWNLEEKVMQM